MATAVTVATSLPRVVGALSVAEKEGVQEMRKAGKVELGPGEARIRGCPALASCRLGQLGFPGSIPKGAHCVPGWAQRTCW